MDHISMMTLIFVTQLVDPEDPGLGFVAGQIRALAKRVDRLVVIANEVRSVPDDLNAEVVSLGKEDGTNRWRRLLRYEAALATLTKEPGSALFVHMCPSYLALAAPWSMARRTPSFLWFAHTTDSLVLRLAELPATNVLSTLPQTYPHPNRKFRPIGHSIDLSLFDPVDFPSLGNRFPILALGRMSPVKGYTTAIDAVKLLRAGGLDATLRIVGPAMTDAEVAHRGELRRQIDRSALTDAVTLEAGVAPSQAAGLMASSAALVNPSIGRPNKVFADKVVFEAMAVGRPALTTSAGFAPLTAGLPVRLDFPAGDADTLAERIAALAALPHNELLALGVELRERIAHGHSLDHWADDVVRLVGGASSSAAHSHP
jgi:glycosyltransferase involved in cell wall biosynthesis